MANRSKKQLEKDLAFARRIEAQAYAASGDPGYAQTQAGIARSAAYAKNGKKVGRWFFWLWLFLAGMVTGPLTFLGIYALFMGHPISDPAMGFFAIGAFIFAVFVVPTFWALIRGRDVE